MFDRFNFFILFVLFGVASSTRHPHWRENTILESPHVTNWGGWGPFENCSCGLVVTGFQLKVEPRHSGDNTAVNGIRFFCGIPGSPNQQEIKILTSSEGPEGDEQEKIFCTTYAVGFQLESQSNQGGGGGAGGAKDDAATTNMKLICEDQTELEGYSSTDQYPGTEYTEPQTCPNQMALCGLQTQLEEPQGGYDDSQLNNVRAKCCKLQSSAPSPGAPTPDPETPDASTPAPGSQPPGAADTGDGLLDILPMPVPSYETEDPNNTEPTDPSILP